MSEQMRQTCDPNSQRFDRPLKSQIDCGEQLKYPLPFEFYVVCLEVAQTQVEKNEHKSRFSGKWEFIFF